MGILRKVLVLVLIIAVIVGAIAAAFFMGLLGAPAAGVQDIGDWGEVSEEETEVITTVWVQNPNPIGLKIGNSVDVSYQLFMNEEKLATGQKSGIDIQPGNNSVSISTFIQNKALPSWWVAFIQANETIPVRVNASAHVAAGPLSSTFEFPSFQRTLLSDSTPVINAISQAAAAAEGNYTQTVGAGPAEETIGYQVQRGWATWGEVNNETTTVLFHFQVHNPSQTTPVPAVPDGIGVSVDMNNITMFRAQGEEFSPKNIDGDAVIRPGQTQEVVLEVEMDNDKIDDWFRSHVKKGEQTQIRTRFQLVFGVQGTEFRMPQERGPSYTCNLQTAILMDNQNTTTNCGQPSSVTGGEAAANQANEVSNTTEKVSNATEEISNTTEEVSNATEETVDDVTNRSDGDSIRETETSQDDSEPPTAEASVNPTEGDAPLEVSFDASGSSDPNGDIDQYVWRFGDGSPPQEGETVSHTYQTAGEYTARLTVIDSEGNQDTTTVTISVDSRV